MKLLMIVLNRDDYFEKILSLLIESGVSGATIFDSEGLGHFLAYEVPIFAGLRYLMGEQRAFNRTIMAIVEKDDIFQDFKRLLKKEEIDFTQPGVGVIATLPLSEVIKPEHKDNSRS